MHVIVVAHIVLRKNIIKKLPLCFGGCPYFSIYKSDEHYMYECNPITLNSLDRVKAVARTSSK